MSHSDGRFPLMDRHIDRAKQELKLNASAYINRM